VAACQSLDRGEDGSGISCVASQIKLAERVPIERGDGKILSLRGLFGESIVIFAKNIEVARHFPGYDEFLRFIISADESSVPVRGDQLSRMSRAIVENESSAVENVLAKLPDTIVFVVDFPKRGVGKILVPAVKPRLFTLAVSAISDVWRGLHKAAKNVAAAETYRIFGGKIEG